MVRQAKYLYWTFEDLGFVSTQVDTTDTKLPVALIVAPLPKEYYRPLLLIHNCRVWNDEGRNLIPINILTGHIDKRHLKKCILSEDELTQIRQFIKKHQEFLIQITKDFDIGSFDIIETLTEK